MECLEKLPVKIRFLLLLAFFIPVQSFSQPHYKFELANSSEFSMFAGEPLTRTFAGVSSVKLVYSLDDQKLYFINSKLYPLHFHFCRDVLANTDLYEFNNTNYRENPGRRYYLSTLNYFRDAGIYTLEFSPADDITRQSAELLYHAVKKAIFESNLYLQLNTSNLLKYSNWNVPVIATGELFAGQKLQVIQKGTATGKLIAADADSLRFLGDVRNCILLIRGNSNEIPLCRGIITNSFQTPLSHISILSQNRKTPLVAMKGAEDNADVLNFLNQYVTLTVSADTFLLKETADHPGDSPLPENIRLKVDTLNRSVVPLSGVRLKHSATYGIKAVNLAEITRTRYRGKPLRTPEGAFAIPMYYYYDHIRRNGIDTLIRSLLLNYNNLSRSQIHGCLDTIRHLIEKGKINKQLVKEITLKMRNSGTTGRYRFRSSSNAEDLEGFNGAGLYTSETGSDDKSVARALRKVWASLWSERAFDERCYSGIDHNTVGMAILAHRSFPDEYINGVAVTRNLYRDFEFGFVINLQAGDNSLVKPDGNESCEQFISYYNSTDPFFNEKQAVEYLSFSSLNKNEPLLTNSEIYELTRQLDRIKRRFYRKSGAWRKYRYKDFAVDVEFKAELQGNRKVFYFKQARPF